LDRALIHSTLSSHELRTTDGIRASAPSVVLLTLPLTQKDRDNGVIVDATGITSREPPPLNGSKTPSSVMTRVGWPVICKRIEACGSTLSHHMVIVTQA
jgi:hypothetical protein